MVHVRASYHVHVFFFFKYREAEGTSVVNRWALIGSSTLFEQFEKVFILIVLLTFPFNQSGRNMSLSNDQVSVIEDWSLSPHFL